MIHGIMHLANATGKYKKLQCFKKHQARSTLKITENCQ